MINIYGGQSPVTFFNRSKKKEETNKNPLVKLAEGVWMLK